MSTDPHAHRDIAEGFGAVAGRYDRARPSYPSALAEASLAGLSGRRVLDVGIGTGISAEVFQRAGATVTGVEPDARMAAFAVARGFAVDVARFEEWEPAGRRFDAVVSGQAWHWVDPDAGARKAAEVLPDGGRLVVFWNAGEPPAELRTAFAEVYRRVETGLPFTPWAAPASAGFTGFTDRATAGIAGTRAFAEPELWEFGWTAVVTTADWLELVPTSGGHNRIAPDRLADLLAGMAEAIDAAGGSFELAYTTIALAATRTPTRRSLVRP